MHKRSIRDCAVDRACYRVNAVLLALFLVIVTYPFLYIVSCSFSSGQALISGKVVLLPVEFTLEGYQAIMEYRDIWTGFANSFLYTVSGTLIGLVLTILAAYPLSRKSLAGRKPIMMLFLFTMLFNGGLVPTYINYSDVFGIKNTFWALMVPSLMMNAFNVLMVKSYFVSSIPDALLEAAYIDGATETRAFVQIALPLAKPIVATIGLFIGIGYWNDWMNGYIYLTKRTDLYSIQNLLNRMIQNIQFLMQNSSSISNANQGLASIPSVPVRMAMAVVGVLPIVIVYPFIQNNFVKGITLGGVKG